jgi:hypothetical protein
VTFRALVFLKTFQVCLHTWPAWHSHLMHHLSYAPTLSFFLLASAPKEHVEKKRGRRVSVATPPAEMASVATTVRSMRSMPCLHARCCVKEMGFFNWDILLRTSAALVSHSV